MRLQEHSSISGRLHRWTPASCCLVPRGLLHDETSRRLKWWTESCLDAMEGKLYDGSSWDVLRLAKCQNKAPTLRDCHSVCLKWAGQSYKEHLWTFKSVPPLSQSRCCKSRALTLRGRHYTFDLWFNTVSIYLTCCSAGRRKIKNHSFIWINNYFIRAAVSLIL